MLALSSAGPRTALRLEPGRLIVCDGQAERRIDLTALPPDPLGYVLRAEESCDPPTTALDKNGQGAPYAVYGYGAQLAEEVVDRHLGTVRVTRIAAAPGLGRVIKSLLARGQVEGGIAQGLGMALMEKFIPGRTGNLHDYLIPTTGDMPQIETIFIKVPDPEGPMGAEGRATCDTLLRLCRRKAVDLQIDGGARVKVRTGAAPVVDGTPKERMRLGCGSATIGMFASQWQGLMDKVVVVDDHITGVVSAHQAGKVPGWPGTGIRIRIGGHRSTPGRYFKAARPGKGWGGTDIDDRLAILDPWWEKKSARPGLSLLMVSTTGEQAGYCLLNDALQPQPARMPEAQRPRSR